MTRALLGTLACLFLLGFGGCVPETTPVSTANVTIPPPVLGPGDVVDINVYLEESLSGEYRLTPEGTIDLPLIGSTALAGLGITKAAEAIEAALRDGYLRNPQVTITVVEYNSRSISVLGQVGAPGRYGYRDGMTLIEAIAEAGGTNDSASLANVQVTRHEADGPIARYNLPFKRMVLGRHPDFLLLPGDVIVVPESALK